MVGIPEVVASGSPDSTHVRADGSAIVNMLTNVMPKTDRELWMSVVLALTIVVLWVVANKLHDADKDLQTQVWLRDDALTKFEQGPFADMKAHVISLESNCKR